MKCYDLPYPFSRVLADEDIDIGRKLDKRNELLTDIKRDASALPEIKGDTSAIKVGIDNLNTKFDSFITERGDFNKEMHKHNMRMDEHNQWMKDHLIKMDEHNMRMDEHNQHLEKILDKLAER